MTPEGCHSEAKPKDPMGFFALLRMTSSTSSFSSASPIEAWRAGQPLDKARSMLTKEGLISNFNTAATWTCDRRRGEKTVNVDLKHYVSRLVVNDQGVIELTLNEREPMVRVSEALQKIFQLSEEMLHNVTIRKTGVVFKT